MADGSVISTPPQWAMESLYILLGYKYNVLPLFHGYFCHHTLWSEQNGCNFGDDIFKLILFDENVCVLIWSSLKYVSEGTTDRNSLMVEATACLKQWWPSLLMHKCVTGPRGINTCKYREISRSNEIVNFSMLRICSHKYYIQKKSTIFHYRNQKEYVSFSKLCQNND